MKHWIDKPIEPVTTKRVLDKTTCDICHKKIIVDSFEVNTVTVSHKTGSSYPEGGNGDLVEYDICSSCFTERVRPFLSALGASPTESEWDW